MADEKPTTEEKEENGTAEQPEAAEEVKAAEESSEKAEETKAEENVETETEEAETQASSDAEETVVEEIPADEKQNIVPGMVVRVHVKIKDVTPKGEERERIQVFEGNVIARKGTTPETATITVRKVSSGIGVERIFPLAMPSIDKIEVVKRYRVRRSKLYYTRTSKKKLKEIDVDKRK